MKRDLNSYFLQTKRQYTFRIKSIHPFGEYGNNDSERSDAIHTLERIERTLLRFEPVAVSKIKRTLIQLNPLDFLGIQNREVYIMDVTLNLPVTADVLANLLHRATGIPRGQILVIGEHDPHEIDKMTKTALEEIEAEALENGWKSIARLEDPYYSEAPEVADDLFGNEATSRFLRVLDAVRVNKPELENPVDYNADIVDAPKTISSTRAKGEEIEGIKTIKCGNLNVVEIDFDEAPTSNRTVIKRVYRDKDGNTKTIERVITAFTKED